MKMKKHKPSWYPSNMACQDSIMNATEFNKEESILLIKILDHYYPENVDNITKI